MQLSENPAFLLFKGNSKPHPHPSIQGPWLQTWVKGLNRLRGQEWSLLFNSLVSAACRGKDLLWAAHSFSANCNVMNLPAPKISERQVIILTHLCEAARTWELQPHF